MREATLVDEICDDHARILRRLNHLGSCRAISHAIVRELTVWIGAHHLAEEDTLYQALMIIAKPHVGEARVFHTVLDDLTDAIERGGQPDEPLRYQILLLAHLLKNHFLTEEKELLKKFADTFSYQQQVDLGRSYRQRFKDNIRVLGSPAVPLQLCRAPPPESLI